MSDEPISDSEPIIFDDEGREPVEAAELTLWARSIYGTHSRKGYVELAFPAPTMLITPGEARSYAASILEAAEAAETDEFLMSWLDQVVGSDLQSSVKLLIEFRVWRDKMRQERKADNG